MIHEDIVIVKNRFCESRFDHENLKHMLAAKTLNAVWHSLMMPQSFKTCQHRADSAMFEGLRDCSRKKR